MDLSVAILNMVENLTLKKAHTLLKDPPYTSTPIRIYSSFRFELEKKEKQSKLSHAYTQLDTYE